MTICRIKQEDRIKAVINAHKQGKKVPQSTPQELQDDEEARDIENDVNFEDRATPARTFSHTLTAKQPHRHGGQPHL